MPLDSRSVKELLASYRQEVEEALDRLLPDASLLPGRLHEAIRYSTLAGGKRVRPILTLLGAEAVGGDRSRVLPCACAYECVHVYSLIHDDLPAMDDDDMRRGKPSNHKVYGEAMAVLAGDALLTLAFELLLRCETTDSAKVRLVRDLADLAGHRGMVGGQVLDMAAESEGVPEDDGAALNHLKQIHAWKTGALITGAVRAGAIASGATDEAIEALTAYGRAIGLAFQIADDVLDATGDTRTLGKTAGKDAEQGKLTYVKLHGVEGARGLADEQRKKARAALAPLGPRAKPLRALADYIVERNR